MFGAGRIIAIDKIPERIDMAREYSKAETLDFGSQDLRRVDGDDGRTVPTGSAVSGLVAIR